MGKARLMAFFFIPCLGKHNPQRTNSCSSSVENGEDKQSTGPKCSVEAPRIGAPDSAGTANEHYRG